MTINLTAKLKSLNACGEAVTWVGDKELPEAWVTCERADWMLWLAGKVVDRKLVVLAACACARTALPHTKDPRALAAIETAEAWTRGEATLEEVRAAAYAVYAANAATDAATDAAYAAYAAYAATDAAAYAVYAANAATDAAAYAANAANAAYAAARLSSLKNMADIVRGIISLEEIQKGLEGI